MGKSQSVVTMSFTSIDSSPDLKTKIDIKK
jgi:hypothetical protein